MTIEQFELEVRNIFIEKGWNTNDANWFHVGIVSSYKSKRVMVSSAQNGDVLATGVGENYPETFEQCITILNQRTKL